MATLASVREDGGREEGESDPDRGASGRSLDGRNGAGEPGRASMILRESDREVEPGRAFCVVIFFGFSSRPSTKDS